MRMSADVIAALREMGSCAYQCAEALQISALGDTTACSCMLAAAKGQSCSAILCSIYERIGTC